MLKDYIVEGVDLKNTLNIPDFSIGINGDGKFTGRQIQTLSGATYDAMYIPYQINAINYCKIDRVDINAISSPFSGCLMVAWQMGGNTFVGHVAREEATHTPSFETWELTKGSFERYVEFDPWRLLFNPQGTKTCYGMIVFSNGMKTVKGYGISTTTDKLGISRVVNQIQDINLPWC